MTANPARGQLNRDFFYPFYARALEFGLVRRVRSPCPASAHTFSISTLNLGNEECTRFEVFNGALYDIVRWDRTPIDHT